MLSFSNISFKYKILLVILSIIIFILIIASLIYINQDKKKFKNDTINELHIISNIISNNCIAPLLFNDTTEAEIILKSLSKHPNIKFSAIFNASKNLFAIYPQKFDIGKCQMHIPFYNDTIIFSDTSYIKIKLIKDESENNKLLGYLVISRNLKDYEYQFNKIIKNNLLISILLLLISILIVFQFQKIISRPILNLSSIVKKISINKDFSLRINKKGNDEIGQLIEGFNKLLDTIEIQNKELISSRDKAIELAKAKQQFLANMSHEIRTPMNAIIGMTNLLLNSRLTDEQRDLLNHISLSANNLLVIINDILDISKIESGKIVFEKYRFNINDTIDNIVKMFETKVKEKGLKLIINKNTDVPNFWLGDQVRLNQILINIVGNAVKFTLKGTVSIDISAKKHENSNIYDVMFKISDTGIGIPDEYKDKIFDTFTQASSSTTRQFGGTGLGLSIAKQLVELQGGKIWFESEVNKGSTFYFYIPLEQAEPPSLKEIEVKAEKDIVNIVNKDIFLKTKILIVEDNKVNQFLLKTMLTKQRFANILVANNGKEALDILQKQDIDLILMDLHMPEMDGYETTKFIRNNLPSDKRNVKIIAITAAVIQGEKEKCFELGMNGYISKPFKPGELFNEIIKLLINK
jgi:signal transduction histidine kinase/ActR/RegA family two-component response regulator